MNPALVLIGAYILVTMVLQLLGFVISRGVDMAVPSLSLLVFLSLFLGSFGLGMADCRLHNATENRRGPTEE